MIELAAFLGNPGPEYEGNRHNAGWLLLKKLPFYKTLKWKKKFQGLWTDIGEQELSPNLSEISEAGAGLPGAVHFLIPQTYMNRSGDSVQGAAKFYKIKPEQILVIHDELELPLGTVSLKFSGGLGGHNGLRSMKSNFGTADFWRLRIGIGRPDERLPGQGGREGSGKGIVDWVLSDFSADETVLLEPVLEAAADLLLRLLVQGPEKYLPQWGKKKIIETPGN